MVTLKHHFRVLQELYYKIKDEKRHQDDAIGGKVHLETDNYYGLSLGASVYSSNAIFYSDNMNLVPFRGENDSSYTILGESYLKLSFGKSLLKIGRQELDTPFAQIDDIGMIANTFEAVIFESKDFKNTSIFLGDIKAMAGVDAKVVDDFTNINGSKHMQVLGLNYEGIKDVDISAWYYRLKDAPIDSILYLEGNYEKEIANTTFSIAIQYARETYLREKDAKVYGGMLGVCLDDIGLTFATAYTKAKDNVATSGFGGGPFYSNSEYLIIDNVGANGNVLWYGIDYDVSKIGVDGLSIAMGKIVQTTAQGLTASELDISASYSVNKQLDIRGIFSNLKAKNVGENEGNNLRVFVNYTF